MVWRGGAGHIAEKARLLATNVNKKERKGKPKCIKKIQINLMSLFLIKQNCFKRKINLERFRTLQRPTKCVAMTPLFKCPSETKCWNLLMKIQTMSTLCWTYHFYCCILSSKFLLKLFVSFLGGMFLFLQTIKKTKKKWFKNNTKEKIMKTLQIEFHA